MRYRKESSFDIHARQNTDEDRTQIINKINGRMQEDDLLLPLLIWLSMTTATAQDYADLMMEVDV
jgi:hypothetical protein